MLLKSLITRKNGSRPSFGVHGTSDETIYHFTGPEGGPHLCDVTDQQHLGRLLAIDPPAFVIAEASDIDAWGGKVRKEPKPAPEGEVEVAVALAEGERKQALSAARAAYRMAFDKAPSPRWDADTILAKITEA